jgi:hypothetical protein
MQPVERGAFELLETRRNYSAGSPQNPIEPAFETSVQTVGEEMTSAKCLCVADQFIERESDRGIVSGDNCAGARANNDIDGNGVGDELLKDADMACAAQSSATHHHGDANRRVCSRGTADSSQGLG